ncbi:CheB methylesterase domain-containing protein [Clostridium sp. AL.422]|uniref:CheB methylesterase domain-containing protein n=1 Tax=Clostridium TaxID=1485 RepID=UPI00293DC57C|nr:MULTISPECIES: CheB methylesterase domain-containing protein [unclassified Clostridium]MDV4149736.1 CheB methylesterase domain-containing protein [Clostridium sp. AL.422]
MWNDAVMGVKDVVLIGASTGGPNAIEKIITKLTRELNAAVLIVQHMPSGFTKSFAERLNKKCKLEVLEANEGMRIEKNKVYIAPGGYHMVVRDSGFIGLTMENPIWGVRPAVDKLFISASSVYGNRIISVVLTGMGKDGAEGTIVVKMNKGITIAQDENSSVIYGMPKCSFETGCVDYVLPLDEIAFKINKIIMKN